MSCVRRSVPSEEFLAVLARRFPRPSDTDTNFVLYIWQSPHELQVDFNKDGGLSGIFALPVLSQEGLDEIVKDIYTEFIETADFGVGRQVSAFTPFVAGGGIAIGYRFSLFRHKAPTARLYAKHPFSHQYRLPQDQQRISRHAEKDSGRLQSFQMLLNVSRSS